MEIRRRTPEGIQRIKGKDYKSTHTYSTQKRRKIQGRNQYIRTCYRRILSWE